MRHHPLTAVGDRAGIRFDRIRNRRGSIACSWTATSGVPWITITAGGSGTGNGTIQDSVAANTGTTAAIGCHQHCRPHVHCHAGGHDGRAAVRSDALEQRHVDSGVGAQHQRRRDRPVGCAVDGELHRSVDLRRRSGRRPGGGTRECRVRDWREPRHIASRVGMANVAGRMFQVTQAGACQYFGDADDGVARQRGRRGRRLRHGGCWLRMDGSELGAVDHVEQFQRHGRRHSGPERLSQHHFFRAIGDVDDRRRLGDR